MTIKKIKIGSTEHDIAAASANKLNVSNVGDTNKPVYFVDGKPVVCSEMAISTHKHAASDITSGTLSVARGGTGGTVAGRTLLSNIGISSGTGEPPENGNWGTIYIQYSE